jgi:hypothetical protein
VFECECYDGGQQSSWPFRPTAPIEKPRRTDLESEGQSFNGLSRCCSSQSL